MKRGIILAIFGFVTSLFIFNNSYATSVSATYSPDSSTSFLKFSDLGSLPDISTLDSTKRWKYTISTSILQGTSGYLYFGNNPSLFTCTEFFSPYNNDPRYPRPITCSGYDFYDSLYQYHFNSVIYGLNGTVPNGWDSYLSDITFTISDDESSSTPAPSPEPSEPCPDPEENSRFVQVVLDAFWKYHVAFASAVPAIIVIFLVYRLLKGRIK